MDTLSTKLSAVSHFLSFKKEQNPFPPSSWNLHQTKNNGAGASSYDPDYWTKEIENMKQASSLNAKSRPPSDIPEPDSVADSIRTHLDESSTEPAEPELVHCLSSEAIMSGEGSKRGESVWAILQRLGPKRKQRQDQTHQQEAEEKFQDGVMVYGPLLPDSNSNVELAESEEVLEYVDDSNQQVENEAKGQASETKVHREWHPSTSKISLQATWWGFRLYLPPPVLAVLSDAHLAAAKRGAIITAALKWLLDRTPVMLVPPTLRPAVATLKRLTPYLGYVGAFVAWSWERIKKKDKGNGVVLSATWILPIALVPTTWDPLDGPKTPQGTKMSEAK